ncbi:MAG: hypothetical protein HXX14_13795 [Bacteroidetes bacterium]|nr:hypothetical protein [Bacteroidota bacterium]
MKKLIYFISLLILFSVISFGCQKDVQSKGTVYTPYADIINPPDTFLIYYNSISFGNQIPAKIQFKTDAVWSISQIPSAPLQVWFNRTDKTDLFQFTSQTTVGLQGSIPYGLFVKNISAPDGANIYLQFIKQNQSYATFSIKY